MNLTELPDRSWFEVEGYLKLGLTFGHFNNTPLGKPDMYIDNIEWCPVKRPISGLEMERLNKDEFIMSASGTFEEWTLGLVNCVGVFAVGSPEIPLWISSFEDTYLSSLETLSVDNISMEVDTGIANSIVDRFTTFCDLHRGRLYPNRDGDKVCPLCERE